MTLDFPKFKSEGPKINDSSRLVLIGSCFTEHIGRRLEQLKCNTSINPMGIAYDPFSLVRQIEHTFTGYKNPKKFLEREGLHLHYDYHSDLHAFSFDELIDKVSQQQSVLISALSNADYLIITLGSSFAYFHNEIHAYVSNCHKIPQKEFKKNLLQIDDMLQKFNACIAELKLLNPKLVIVVTVSPVKHLKDGIVENVRSKARLIELAHLLAEEHNHVTYYPVFEMVQECLRDYRFYNEDYAHPNSWAQKLVFEAFVKDFFSSDAQESIQKTEQLLLKVKHKSLHPGSESHQKFLQSLYLELNDIQQKHPHQNWSEEIKTVQAAIR